MKFYNRTKELEALNQVREMSFDNHSMLTVLTGRRRIGKTSLVMKSCEGYPTVYLFINRGNEAALCADFLPIIGRTLNVFVPSVMTSFAELFDYLMNLGLQKKFNLVIDEFQEFFYINPVVYSKMQDIWDRHRLSTHVNLIVSGSIYTLMNRIFRDSREPLYGRADRLIKLMPFATSVLKEILSDYKPDYTNEDLLTLYTFTGGIPKYIELFMDNNCTDMEQMVRFMTQPYSPFIEEGRTLLIQEFGKKYGNYFSIISAIAGGRNTIPELESLLSDTSLGGLMKRLEEDYEVITKKRPIFAKEGTKTVRYEIADHFLRFWFRYFDKYGDFIAANNLEGLAEIMIKDYPTYSGLLLEYYFKEKMIESHEFRNIGSWWQGKNNKNQDEIDIIGIYADNRRAFVAEVKRQRKNFKPELFLKKIEAIRHKELFKYEIESKCLSMEDM